MSGDVSPPVTVERARERGVVEVTAVLFDMGGTLLSYGARAELARPTVEALGRLGVSIEDPVVRDAMRRAGEDVERDYATRRSFLHRDLFRDRIARAATLLGVAAPPEVLDHFDEAHRQAIVDHLTPMPGVMETLAGLRTRGLYVGVVSNADDDHVAPLLRRHGIDALVDDWTSSEEAGSCKPDAGIFEYSLAKAGRPASATLFVGDSPQHDVTGAARVGMRTVLLGRPGAVAPLSFGLDGSDPDFAVDELVEILAIVDRCNSPA